MLVCVCAQQSEYAGGELCEGARRLDPGVHRVRVRHHRRVHRGTQVGCPARVTQFRAGPAHAATIGNETLITDRAIHAAGTPGGGVNPVLSLQALS